MSSIPISKTKIIPPSRRPQLLTRKRLLEFMYEALDKKLTLISAPAGYGKTSLLIDLIHDEGNEWKNCWLALDELDREPQRFAAYFIASISQQFKEFGKQSNDVLDNMKSFDQDMERLLVTLINELLEHTSGLFVVILDDFHLVEEVQSIRNFVNRFIQLMPENCNLIISSRKLAEFPELTLLIARGQASGLDFSDLAFQAEEIQTLIAQNENRHISDEEAERLAKETEGWITGLQFSNIKLPSSGDQSNLFNYFRQQVLDKQSPELKEFILRTSLFEEFDSNLCELVLQPLYSQKQDWQTFIKNTASNNAFALPVGENGNWIRYHHLFRDFVREQFKAERPDEVNPLLSNLQLAYEARGEWEKAHHICKQLNDSTALAKMIERAGSFMLQRANMILDSWMNELPASMLKERPRLLSIRGALVYLKGDLQESLNLLNQAEPLLREENDVTELALTLSRRANTYRLLGEYEKSLSDIDDFIQLTEDKEEHRYLYAEALRSKGITHFRMGQVRKSVESLEKSLNIYEQLPEKEIIPILLMDIGLANRAIGEFEKTKQAYIKALDILEREGNIYQQANLLNNLGVFYQFLGQYEDAVFAFEKGLLCAQRSKNVRIDALISIGLGDLYAELEDFDMVYKNYQHANEVIKLLDEHFLSHSLALSQANAAFLQGDKALAHQLIEKIKEPILTGGSNYEMSFLSLICGRLALLEKNFKKALEGLEHAEKHFSADGRSVEADVARVWLAAALHQNKKSSEAIKLLNSLSTVRGKIFHPAIVAAYQAREWLEDLQSGTNPSRTVRELITGAEKFAKEIPPTRRQVKRQSNVIPPSAPKFNIQAFGNAMVYVDGKPLTKSDWQTQAVRDLFFYFLSIHKPMTKEQIGELLWPDTYESAKLNLRFKNDMYRLRKAVGQNVIVYENDFYRFNHHLDYEYDVEAFEKFIANAQKSQDTKRKIDLYQKAVDLVQGPYLNDVYADWVMPERIRLEQVYLNSLIELANLYQANGQPEHVIRVYEKIVELEPSNETACQIAMQAYHRLKNRPAIMRMYQACKEALKTGLGLELSHETEELYRKLTK
ncbi:MAG: tetratricopeptide repeat protein [Anaerolineales bacterium]|nr:tetratricopeptide repeat protein [Anaerolineales bacterium]